MRTGRQGKYFLSPKERVYYARLLVCENVISPEPDSFRQLSAFDGLYSFQKPDYS